MRTAVVSGGTSGIGKGIVEQLLEDGFSVTTFSRSEERRERLERELPHDHLSVVEGDVSDEERMTEIVRDLSIDVLVNNAGIGYWTPADEVDIPKFRRMLDVNLVGPAALTKAALPRMKPGGMIINISSIAGKRGYARGAFYNATKFGLMGYSEALRKEREDIRICTICPGMVETELFGDELDRRKAAGQVDLLAVPDVQRVVSLVVNQSDRSDIQDVTIMPYKRNL